MCLQVTPTCIYLPRLTKRDKQILDVSKSSLTIVSEKATCVFSSVKNKFFHSKTFSCRSH